MIDKRDRFRNRGDAWCLRQGRTAQQDYLGAEHTRRGDLSVSGCTTAVLRYHHFNTVSFEQRTIVFFGERPARFDVGRVRHGQRRIDRLDATHEIIVLWCVAERCNLLATKGEKDASWRRAERAHSFPCIADFSPAVASDWHPGRTSQSQKRDASHSRRPRSILRYCCRVGMGCVDEHVDMLGAEVLHKPLGAAEAADAYRYRHGQRRISASGERERKLKTAVSEPLAEQSCFCRAAENEDVHAP